MKDTHAHLMDACYTEDIDEVIKNAISIGVTRILLIALDIEEYKMAYKLKESYKIFDIGLGYHPSYVNELNNNWYEELEEYISNDNILCVGEIGLDYHWDKDNKDKQKNVFRKQIELAIKYDKAIVVHSRDAMEDTINILKEYPEAKGIIHCFSGSKESAKILVDMGYYISVGGPLTFKNAASLLEVFKSIPLNRLLLETDCPYLTPHPFRGKRNEPKFIEYTYNRAAELLEVDLDYLDEVINNNYKELFNK